MIKIFAEFHGGKRCPNISYRLNNANLIPGTIETVDRTSVLRKMIISLPCEFQQGQNHLTLIQQDKTDDDLIFNTDGMIDHYVDVKEIEIDGIRLESVLYQAQPTFEHSMPDTWVEMMTQQGFDIPKIYYNTTQLRLNGEWHLVFESPVWRWRSQKLLS